MVRKLAIALLGAGVMVPGLVNALGLGEIKVRSALSEPLNAEVEILQAKSLTADEILVSLAGSSEFANQGIERFPYLNDLRFEVVMSPGGRSQIRITSRKPIKEPYLDFLIEVNWPQGRIVREMTMLLDPPVYKPQVAPVVKRPAAASTSMRAAPASAPVKPVPAASNTSAPSASDTYGPTRSSDSLWSIAKRVQPSGRVNVQQTMLALQQLNPSAFVNGNINMLKRGQVMRLPDEAQIMAIDARDAIRMVEEQTRAWRDRSAAPKREPTAAPVDTVAASSAPAPTAPAVEEAKLVLVSSADGNGSGDSAQGGAGSGGVLRDKLAVAEEAADAAKLQNEDLKAKVGDLQQMTEQTNAILKLKDDQIAALQSRLAEMEAEIARIKEERAAAAGAAAEPASSTEPAAGTPPSDSDPVVTDAAATIDPAAPSSSTESDLPVPAPVTSSPEVSAVETGASGEAQTAAPVAPPVDYNTAPEAGVAVTDVQQPALIESAVAPADASTVPPQETSIVDKLLASPLMLAGVGGALLALVGGLFVAAGRGRRGAPSKETKPEIKLPPKTKVAKPSALSAAVSATPAPAPLATPEPAAAPRKPVAEDPLDSLSDNMFKQEATPVLGGTPSAETLSQTSDVVGEADIYIAYGRFPQAVEMLERALVAEPGRNDVMLKLLEVAAESRDRDLFDRYAPALLATGDRAISHKVQSFESLLPARELDLQLDDVIDETPAEVNLAGTVSAPGMDDLPPLEFDMGSSRVLAATAEAARADVAAELPSLDFDLPDSGQSQADAGVELDTDFAFDAGVEPAEPEAAASELTISEVEEVIELDFAGLEDDVPEAPSVAFVEAVPVAANSLVDTGDLSFELDPVDEVSGAAFDETPVVRPEALSAEEGDLQFSSDGDEVATKLDLARAYIDMGDRDGARDILDEVLVEGSEEQKAEAKGLMARL